VTRHVGLTGADAAPEKDLAVEAGMAHGERGTEVALCSPAAKDMLLHSVSQNDLSKMNPPKEGKESPFCPFIQFCEQGGLRQWPFCRKDRLAHVCLLFAG